MGQPSLDDDPNNTIARYYEPQYMRARQLESLSHKATEAVWTGNADALEVILTTLEVWPHFAAFPPLR